MDDIGTLLNAITAPDIKPKVYSKKIISNWTKEKLLPYQIPHVAKLINILVQKFIALDLSDTGVGKTYLAIAVCKELGLEPIIYCPKTIMYNWLSVCSYFNVKPYDIVNYETIKNGKTYTNFKFKSRKKSPYLDIVDPDPDDANKTIYQWNLPKNVIVIFDEAHRCKDPSTENGKFLMSVKQLIEKKNHVLILSATICEHFSDVKILFYLLGLIPNTRGFKHYLTTLKHKYPKYIVRKRDFPKTKEMEYKTACENGQAMMIYEEIKDFSSRIRIKDLGDQFPANQICCQQFIAEESDKIAQAYDEIALHMEELKRNPGRNHLAQIQKLKQEIELRKVPIYIEQTQLFLDEGKSVIIFVNYLDTLRVLSDHLAIRCQIYGEQTMEQRQEAIMLFQSNQERIIICQSQAGGIGISLHDIHGGHPRATLMNYPDRGSTLVQCLGRAARSGAKSVVIQRIIFVANVTYERKIMLNINRRLAKISLINDADLDAYKYKVKKITRKEIKKE